MFRESGGGRPAASAFGSARLCPVREDSVAHQSVICITAVIVIIIRGSHASFRFSTVSAQLQQSQAQSQAQYSFGRIPISYPAHL